MKVGYTKAPAGGGPFPWLPLLNVQLRGPEGIFPLPMLVDTGSIETILPSSLVQQLVE